MTPLDRLFAPRSIAVIGGDPADRVVSQCRKLGYEGEIWPVHPTRRSLGGLTAFPSLDALPGVPDAAFVGVNRRATVDVVRELAALGCGGAVGYGSGFAETGASELQFALLDAAGSMPLLGPNCYGYVNTFARVALWPDEHGLRSSPAGAAIVSQSGNVAVNLTLQQRGLRLATMITVGNQASLGVDDCIEWLLDDERVTVIGLFIEAVRDAEHFSRACLRAYERNVPVVALHTGRSRAGARIATSHTGSMSGRAAAYEALFARNGVATVETPAQLLESLKLLDRQGRLADRTLVSLSCSGGEASLVADLVEPMTISCEPFTVEHQARIAATVDEFVTVTNPFDYHTFMWGDRGAMATCFTEVMRGPQAVTMLVLDAPPAPDNDATAWKVAVDAFGDAVAITGRRGVVVATLAECLNEAMRDAIEAQGLVPLLGLHEALVALDVAATDAGVQPSAPAPLPHHAVSGGAFTTVLDESTAKQRLAQWDIAVPLGTSATWDGVIDAADRIGYPVVLKALGLAHKSEVAAVRVGLRDAAEVADALTTMPRTESDVLVEATVSDAVAELLVSVRRDPPIGWLVTVGFGGVTTEVWSDTVHLLAPVAEADVAAAVAQLKSAPLLEGFRGRARADVGALCTLVVHLVDAVVNSTDVVEVELNPVIVGVAGAVAVDALITIEERV